MLTINLNHKLLEIEPTKANKYINESIIYIMANSSNNMQSYKGHNQKSH